MGLDRSQAAASHFGILSPGVAADPNNVDGAPGFSQSGAEMFKSPGGLVAFWSVVLILAGGYVAYDSFSQGKMLLGWIFLIPVVGGILMWLDVRMGKWLVAGYLAFVTFGVAMRLSSVDLDVSLIARGLMAGYGAYLFAKWDGPETA